MNSPSSGATTSACYANCIFSPIQVRYGNDAAFAVILRMIIALVFVAANNFIAAYESLAQLLRNKLYWSENTQIPNSTLDFV